MSSRIIITGASGFIGTNLLESFIDEGHEVLNLDIEEPKISIRSEVWKRVDIRKYEELENAVLTFNPEYIVHLAARTDLNGKTIADYDANTIGVKNLMTVIQKLPTLKKIIITSSKFVCSNGYEPKDQFDYAPHTVYGKSKVITEKVVWENKPKCDWCIIRPTSIWGPWFGVPYRNFFDMIHKNLFFHIGKKECFKTYGYIGNSMHQIKTLLFTETLDEVEKVYYIGDYVPYEINQWADEIGMEMSKKIHTIPYGIMWIAAKFGDGMKKVGITFPMTSFRLGNMTNDGTNNLSKTQRIVGTMPFDRIEGTRITVKWLLEDLR